MKQVTMFEPEVNTVIGCSPLDTETHGNYRIVLTSSCVRISLDSDWEHPDILIQLIRNHVVIRI